MAGEGGPVDAGRWAPIQLQCLGQELESLLAVAESCVESLGDTVDAAGLERAEDAVKARWLGRPGTRSRPVRSTS